MQDTPRNIHNMIGSNWSSSFRGEEFWKIDNDDDGQWQKPNDGNNSHDLPPVDLKNSSFKSNNSYKESLDNFDP